jgi:hypothetical protein
MPLQPFDPGVHRHVLPEGDPLQDGLDVGYVLGDDHRECTPVQHVAERQHEVVGDDHLHALVVEGLLDVGLVTTNGQEHKTHVNTREVGRGRSS